MSTLGNNNNIINSGSIYNKTDININNINNSLNRERMIRNKIKVYKEKLSKPFLERIEKEKKNEYKRVEMLSKIKDKKLKKDMEKKFGIERGRIDMELTKEKKNINKAIKNYEKSFHYFNNLLVIFNI